MNQCTDLAQELQDMIEERERYREAWEAEKVLSKTYKELSEHNKQKLNDMRVALAGLTICYIALAVILLWR